MSHLFRAAAFAGLKSSVSAGLAFTLVFSITGCSEKRHPKLVPLVRVITDRQPDLKPARKPVETLTAKYDPRPVRTDLRVREAGVRMELWNKLSEPEKKLAYHLHLAGKHGRDILFYQAHRHALVLREVLHASVRSENAAKTAEILGTAKALQEWQAYIALFEENGGPYHGSNRKFILKEVSATQVGQLLAAYGNLDADSINEVTRLLTDPVYETLKMPEEADGSDLLETGGNLYEKGISGPEVAAALKAGLKVELNCRVVAHRRVIRDGNRVLSCEKMIAGADTPAGRALSKVVIDLENALTVADENGRLVMTELQQQQTRAFIKYFSEGNIEDFRQANIAWVKDGTSSKIDYMIGFVEVYDDYLGSMGSWESYVQIVDPDTTKATKELAKNAQYFEDKMPYGPWKKTFEPGYAPPAIMAFYFQEITSARSGGYNLPNFDDIRRDVGFKNVIRLDMPGESSSPLYSEILKDAYRVFFTADQVDPVLANKEKAWRVEVLLHEIIGHGSGTYDEAKYPNGADPISTLGKDGSALEEQRADLAALTFAGDPKLIEAGLYANAEEALRVRNSLYDFYTGNFLVRLARNRTVSEAHARGNWLFINQLLKAGVIAWVNPDGTAPSIDTQVLKILDYDRYHSMAQQLLGELQRIKAERDEPALKAIFEQDAPLSAVNEPWAKSVIMRGEGLRLMAGAVDQPWSIRQEAGGLSLTVCGEATLESLMTCLGQY